MNGVTTVYIAGVYEYQGGATTLYYEGNAIRRSGYASDNGVFYLLQDHLKSSSAFVTQAGVVNSRNYFYPFGGNRGGSAFSSLTTKRFTGQYHEAGLPGGEGLSYYGARWYDAKLGRFLSADTIVPGPANPQAFNRYSYVLNSPTGLVDPSGHLPMRDDGGRTRKAAGLGAGATGDAAGRAWLHRFVYNHWQPVLRSLPQNTSIKEFFASAVIKDARKLGVGYTTARVFHPTSNDVTLALTNTLNEASNSPMVAAMRDVQRYDGLTGFTAANAMWTSLVGTGAIWDFKGDIVNKFGTQITTVVVGSQRLHFQAVANIGFGYLGDRAGFPPTWLQFGAGMAQIENGVTHWQGNLQAAPQYFGDQEFDGWAVGFGFYLSERYATMPLTPAMVTVAMTDYVAMYPIPEGP